MSYEWPEHFQPDVVKDGFGGKLTSYTLALEAWRRGLNVAFLDSELRKYQIGDESGHQVTFIRSRPHMSTQESIRTANNKFSTTQLLRASGVPAPASRLVDTAAVNSEELAKLAEEVGYPVVIKPADGSMGRGVFANIQNREELSARYADLLSSITSQKMVLESHISGDDYRVLVYKDSVVGACLRRPANVVGDGQSTVQQLITAKNNHRKQNPFLSKGLIKVDHEVEYFLSRHGYDIEGVPRLNEHLQLRSAANASAGGDVIDVTHELPTSITDACVAAVAAIPGLFCAGVDVLYDRNADSNKQNYAILELNAHPQIGVNMYPTHGVGQDAPKTIIDICFPESRRSQDSGDRSLSLPRLRELLGPLRNGSASSVSLAEIPRHRFTTRLTCQLELAGDVTRLQQNRLLRLARTHDIAGFLDIHDGSSILMSAGNETGVQQFIRDAGKVLKSEPKSSTTWTGPVAPGFTITTG